MGIQASSLVMDAALLPYRLSKLEAWRLKRTMRDIIRSYSADCRKDYPVKRVPYQFFNRKGYYQQIVKNQINQLNELIDNCEEPTEPISIPKRHLDNLKQIPGFRVPSHVDEEGSKGGARRTKRQQTKRQQTKRQRHIKRQRTRKA
jgi:hypothetical protein